MHDKQEKSEKPEFTPHQLSRLAGDPVLNPESELTDDKLESVSGGLREITIEDTCRHEFSFQKCYLNLGKCPNLLARIFITHFDESRQTQVYEYLFSCAKGYFYNEKANMDRILPDY